MPEIFLDGVAETLALGSRWGTEAQPGLVIGLAGDLGAGKTQLVKGVATGLGIRSRVQSPTFPLVLEYNEGRLPLFHLDLYRLDGPDQILGAGLEPYFYQRNGVTVVEWVERWLGNDISNMDPAKVPFGRRFRLARLETVSETQRRLTYEDFGA